MKKSAEEINNWINSHQIEDTPPLLSIVPQFTIDLVSSMDPTPSPPLTSQQMLAHAMATDSTDSSSPPLSPNPLRSPIPHPQVQQILNRFFPKLTGGINIDNHFKRRRRKNHQ